MKYELSRDDAGKIREPGKLVRIQQTYADRILSYIHWLRLSVVMLRTVVIRYSGIPLNLSALDSDNLAD